MPANPSIDIDVQVVYWLIQPNGEVYSASNTRVQASRIAVHKAGMSDYGRMGYTIRPRICPTIVVRDNGQSMEFIGGSY